MIVVMDLQAPEREIQAVKTFAGVWVQLPPHPR